MKFCGNRTDNDVLNRKIILIQLFANECSKFKFNAICIGNSIISSAITDKQARVSF